MINKLGLIGDVHGEDALLEQALETLERRGVSLIASTGDIVDGGASVDRCCELLEAYGVETVAGNHDRWLLAGVARNLTDATNANAISVRSRTFLQKLPRMIELNVAGGRALLCHGLGPNDMAKVGPDDFGYAIESNEDLQNLIQNNYYRWVLNGHSHRRMVKSFGKLTIVNAGTLKREHSPCFLEIDFGEAEVHFFEFTDDGVVEAATVTLT